MASEWTIRDYEPDDEAAVRALNAANVPEVGPLDDERLAFFAADGAPGIEFDVGVLAGAVVALFVGLPEGTRYWSPNYRWFADRYARFAYVDRIAVAEPARGSGLAHAFYERFEVAARTRGAEVVCAEVNVEPPNPRSLRFHERLGFEVVAEEAPYGTDERVAMVVKPLQL